MAIQVLMMALQWQNTWVDTSSWILFNYLCFIVFYGVHFVGSYTEYNKMHGMSITKLAYLTFTSVLFHCPCLSALWMLRHATKSQCSHHWHLSTHLLTFPPILVGMPRSYPLHNTITPTGSSATFLLLPSAPTLTQTLSTCIASLLGLPHPEHEGTTILSKHQEPLSQWHSFTTLHLCKSEQFHTQDEYTMVWISACRVVVLKETYWQQFYSPLHYY